MYCTVFNLSYSKYQRFIISYLYLFIMIKEVEDVEESEEFLEEIEEQELMPLNRHLKGRRTGKGSRGNTETEAMYK